ncbi:hypothetical protein D9M70_636750 [compost metagenome]
MSLVKPMGALSALSLYENGIWLSRAPIWIVPLSLILRSVPASCALAAPQAKTRASANARGARGARGSLKSMVCSLGCNDGGLARIFCVPMNF